MSLSAHPRSQCGSANNPSEISGPVPHSRSRRLRLTATDARREQDSKPETANTALARTCLQARVDSLGGDLSDGEVRPVGPTPYGSKYQRFGYTVSVSRFCLTM